MVFHLKTHKRAGEEEVDVSIFNQKNFNELTYRYASADGSISDQIGRRLDRR